MTPSRLLYALLFISITTAAGNALALDIAPGTTSPTLQATGCAINSGDFLGFPCGLPCAAGCDLAENTAQASLALDNLDVGSRFVESTVYTDFTVTTGENGAATGVDATIDYDVEWKGGWTITGVFVGWNEAKSTMTLTITDQTAGGTVVRSTQVGSKDLEGFIGIDIIDVGFGLDQGASVNAMSARLIRGHTYRVGLKVRCESKSLLNAFIGLDYASGPWGLWWNDLKVSVAPDLVEEIEKLKKRVAALEGHTHTYLTGRGEGHNNTDAETSKPILVDVGDPSDEERKLLPAEDAAEALPVKSVFLANAPNPFNPSTTITFTLPERLYTTIRIYDAQGRLARTLVSEDRAAGPHAVAFEGEGMASGVYYYRLTAGRFVETRKLTLVR